MHDLCEVPQWMLALLLAALLGGTVPMNQLRGEVDMITEDTTYQKRSTPTGAGVQDIKMQVHVMGDGPPLVLVGGGLTGWKSWEGHAERLAATRTVARLQLLSVQYGLEDRPLPDGYSASMESAALAAALDELDWHEPLDLVAWSYGALVTLDFALDHPERVRTLTLIEPPAAWVLPDRGLTDPFVEALQSLDIADDVTEAGLERFLHAVSLIPPGSSPKALPQWPVWMQHRRSLRVAVEPVNHDDDSERLRAFDRPVLLVAGTGTTPFLRRVHDTLAAHLPRARTTEMPAGHAPHLVSMDRFLSELAQFHQSAGIATHRAISKDGTPISYLRRGAGPALLFVHGTTADHRSWAGISEYLEQDFTVYAMDRRGRGESGDGPGHDLMREVEDVVAVVEAIGEPVFLFGHSFGGLVSLEAALLTDKVSRLILYEPPIPTGEPILPPGVRKRIHAPMDRGDLEKAMEVFMREVALLTEDELQAYRQTPLWKARLPLIVTVPRELAIETTYVFDAARFTELRIATTLLLGEDSPEIQRQGVERVHAAIPSSEIVILPGQQHVAHLMNPELVAKELLRFRVD